MAQGVYKRDIARANTNLSIGQSNSKSIKEAARPSFYEKNEKELAIS